LGGKPSIPEVWEVEKPENHPKQRRRKAARVAREVCCWCALKE